EVVETGVELAEEPVGIHPGTLRDAVVEVDHAAAEAPLVQELELQAKTAGQRLRAAADDDRRDEQVELVDEAGRERLGGEPGAAHGEVMRRLRFQLPDRVGVEVSLEPRPR